MKPVRADDEGDAAPTMATGVMTNDNIRPKMDLMRYRRCSTGCPKILRILTVPTLPIGSSRWVTTCKSSCATTSLVKMTWTVDRIPFCRMSPALIQRATVRMPVRSMATSAPVTTLRVRRTALSQRLPIGLMHSLKASHTPMTPTTTITLKFATRRRNPSWKVSPPSHNSGRRAAPKSPPSTPSKRSSALSTTSSSSLIAPSERFSRDSIHSPLPSSTSWPTRTARRMFPGNVVSTCGTIKSRAMSWWSSMTRSTYRSSPTSIRCKSLPMACDDSTTIPGSSSTGRPKAVPTIRPTSCWCTNKWRPCTKKSQGITPMPCNPSCHGNRSRGWSMRRMRTAMVAATKSKSCWWCAARRN
mmetsp:Transcript_18833/g.52343  ORF Transcript_18833/g.52343 Transcript_18833/m.52343 type:complete len:357 (+) Transcript_18833:369-1439(+)